MLDERTQINDRLGRWLNKRGDKSSVLVYPKRQFGFVADRLSGINGIAYISIESSADCARYWMEEEKHDNDNDHYLRSSENVLNIEFDDLTSDREYKGHIFKAITQEQADIIVGFIEGHLGDDIIVHCKAGSSRSQAVFRFIMDMYPDIYEPCDENRNNPCECPNVEVVVKLKRSFYRKHNYLM
jgi:hypothetical protein